MSTCNICFLSSNSNENRQHTQTMKLLDCALIGVYAVIRSNTVCFGYSFTIGSPLVRHF